MKKNGSNLWKLSYVWKETLNDELNWIDLKINQRKMGCKLVEKVWKLKYIHEHGVAKKNFQKYTNIKNHICMPFYMGMD